MGTDVEGARLTSPVGLAQVRGPPEVAQAHGKPDTAQAALELVVPLGPLVPTSFHRWVRLQRARHAHHLLLAAARGLHWGWEAASRLPCRYDFS